MLIYLSHETTQWQLLSNLRYTYQVYIYNEPAVNYVVQLNRVLQFLRNDEQLYDMTVYQNTAYSCFVARHSNNAMVKIQMMSTMFTWCKAIDGMWVIFKVYPIQEKTNRCVSNLYIFWIYKEYDLNNTICLQSHDYCVPYHHMGIEF